MTTSNKQAIKTVEPGTDTEGKAEIAGSSTQLPYTDTEENDSIEYSFDDYYLDSFIAGHSKTECYKRACIATGYDISKHPIQSAHSLHKRLESSGELDKAMSINVRDDRVRARLKLLQLLDADSEAVQLSSAKHISGNTYSDEVAAAGIEVHVTRDTVEIKHRNQTLTVDKSDK